MLESDIRPGYVDEHGEVLDIISPETCLIDGLNDSYLVNGKGPHAAQIMCGKCHRHIKWISAEYLQRLLTSYKKTKEAV